MASDIVSKVASKRSATLVYAAFIAGLCSIIYELLIATTASYFLGNSVTYFSLTIGIYMAAMGLGTYLSQYLEHDLLTRFVVAELCLGAVGGLCIPLLYLAYAYTDYFMALYVLLTTLIGLLIGLEIPFLTRLMEEFQTLKSNIAQVLSFDYLGALIATLAFPFILLPFFGVYQSSLLFGLVNMSIGFALLKSFEQDIPRAKALQRSYICMTLLLGTMLWFSSSALKHWDQSLYDDRIILSKQTPYQKIVMTQYRDDLRLFIDGNLQFSSKDEHRYHESLVHIPLAYAPGPVQRVLLLGAGDGLALRELHHYPQIEEIVLVDLDPAMVTLAKHHEGLTQLNQNSLSANTVSVEHQDAFVYLRENQRPFDLIIADLPDPNNDVLARLYSTHFYLFVRQNLSENGLFVTQATSPYFATDAFWSIVKTLQASSFKTKPYHVQIPSFGDWGFVLAAKTPLQQQRELPDSTKFLDQTTLQALFSFEKDVQPQTVAINRLDQPSLLPLYLKGWKEYAQ